MRRLDVPTGDMATRDWHHPDRSSHLGTRAPDESCNTADKTVLEVDMSMVLAFGKYKGKALEDCPPSYLAWLICPILKDTTFYPVPDDIKLAAKGILEASHYAQNRISGMASEKTDYLIERLGDIDGLTSHSSLAEALAQIEKEYPLEDGQRFCDPEDNRILVWEILPSGHRKVVWHFSGWHWNVDEFYKLEQGKLPGDEHSLYHMSDG